MPKKTPKVGRPAMAKKEKRVTISLRVSPAELRLIDGAAKRLKEKPATWRRNALLKAAEDAKSNT